MITRAHITLISAVSLALLGGCAEERDYASGSVDEVVASAKSMVANGDAEYLATLIHAEDAQMRSLLNQAGLTLGALQDLAEAVAERFPEELAEFREEMTVASEEDRASSLRRWLAPKNAFLPSGMVGGLRGGSALEGLQLSGLSGEAPSVTSPSPLPQISESQREIFVAIAAQVLADPYGWLDEKRSRLGTFYIDDDTVGLAWDERPVLPPVFLILRQSDDGRWQIHIPWHFYPLSEFKPRTESEYFVFGSIFKTLENVAVDLRRDIRSGSIRNITDLADSAVEKAAIPLVLVFTAYSSLVDAREQTGEETESQAQVDREDEAEEAETP